jgi:hypothetical protein
MNKRRSRLVWPAIAVLILIAASLACGRRDEEPTPTPTVTPTPVGGVEPGGEVQPTLPPAPPTSTPVPGGCADGMEFLADVTVPDGTIFGLNEPFIKTWRVRNAGSCNWTGYHVVFADGEPMGTMDQPIEDVPAGEELEISVEMTAPGGAGNYTGRWQVQSPGGAVLGTLTCVITVEGGGPPPEESEESEEPTEEPEGSDEGPLASPLVPSDLVLVDWSGSMANMAFTDNADNEEGFHVYVNGSVYRTLGPNQTTFQVGPNCGTVYNVYVTSFNAAGESTASNDVDVSGLCGDEGGGAGAWEGNLQARVEGDALIITWADIAGEETYHLTINTTGIVLEAGTTSYTWEDAPCGTEVEITLVAMGSGGEIGRQNLHNVDTPPCEAAGANLVIVEAYFEPEEPVKGQEFTARLRVRNDGDVATGPFTIRWTFHPSLGLEACEWQNEGLNAGVGGKRNCSRMLSAGNPGTGYKTTLTVDADGEVPEPGGEGDNSCNVPLRVVAP